MPGQETMQWVLFIHPLVYSYIQHTFAECLAWILLWCKHWSREGKALPAENRAQYMFFEWNKRKQVGRGMDRNAGCSVLLCKSTLLMEV